MVMVEEEAVRNNRISLLINVWMFTGAGVISAN